MLSKESQRDVTACQCDNHLTFWDLFEYFFKWATSSSKQKQCTLTQFFKCIAINFKCKLIFLNNSLQSGNFVESMIAKLVLCVTQLIDVRKGFTFSFDIVTTPLFLPTMVDAPFELNATHLSKSNPHSFILLVNVSKIIHTS